MQPIKRIGLIVPSSNTTIETEVPAMIRRARLEPEVTFHASRSTLHNVDRESLRRMVGEGDRCVRELADARVDVVAYACLVALMAEGARAHERVEARLSEVAAQAGHEVPVISSAGALIRTLQAHGARRVAIMTPYVPSLTAMVARYIEAYGIEVVDSVSLSVPDNLAVGRLPVDELPAHARGLDLSRVDMLIASACVQMPSLGVLDRLEHELGVPAISAATATTAELLTALDAPARVPGAGAALRAQAAPAA